MTIVAIALAVLDLMLMLFAIVVVVLRLWCYDCHSSLYGKLDGCACVQISNGDDSD